MTSSISTRLRPAAVVLAAVAALGLAACTPSGGHAARDLGVAELSADQAGDGEVASTGDDAEAPSAGDDPEESPSGDDAEASPSGEAAGPTPAPAPDGPAETATDGAPPDSLTLHVTWPERWEEQPAAAETLPPGSIAMGTAFEDGTVAGATVVVHTSDPPTDDMPALLTSRGNDPASITEAGSVVVAGSPSSRWEARDVSGEWDTIAHAVEGPEEVVVLLTFVVSAGHGDAIEEDVAAVLASVELT